MLHNFPCTRAYGPILCHVTLLSLHPVRTRTHTYIQTRKCMYCACIVELLSHTRTYIHIIHTYKRGQYSATPNTGCDDTRALGPTHSWDVSPSPVSSPALFLSVSLSFLSSSLRRRRRRSPTRLSCPPPPTLPPPVAIVYCSVRERLPAPSVPLIPPVASPP